MILGIHCARGPVPLLSELICHANSTSEITGILFRAAHQEIAVRREPGDVTAAYSIPLEAAAEGHLRMHMPPASCRLQLCAASCGRAGINAGTAYAKTGNHYSKGLCLRIQQQYAVPQSSFFLVSYLPVSSGGLQKT